MPRRGAAWNGLVLVVGDGVVTKSGGGGGTTNGALLIANINSGTTIRTGSSPVVHNGTGEMIFVQQGRRAGVPIRSENGHAIAAGKEVVVTRFEQGIAYVREWEELTA